MRTLGGAPPARSREADRAGDRCEDACETQVARERFADRGAQRGARDCRRFRKRPAATTPSATAARSARRTGQDRSRTAAPSRRRRRSARRRHRRARHRRSLRGSRARTGSRRNNATPPPSTKIRAAVISSVKAIGRGREAPIAAHLRRGLHRRQRIRDRGPTARRRPAALVPRAPLGARHRAEVPPARNRRRHTKTSVRMQ